MAIAYVDTTVLTDILLKVGTLCEAAKTAVGRYTETQLPVYAIKEFKAGPLTHFVYFHNVLVETGSWIAALDKLQRLSGTLQRAKASTVIEALKTATSDISDELGSELKAKYGNFANYDAVHCDVNRLALKRRIYKAWTNRRNVTTTVVLPLSCFEEKGPVEKRSGLIDITPRTCPSGTNCCLHQQLVARPEDLKKLRDAVDASADKPENSNRSQVLKKLIGTPKRPIGDKECRHLGDAIFAFFAPDDSIVLTTNDKDHKPLAEALSKTVNTP